MSKKLVLIDGHSILNRAYYGVPELTNREGLHTNAVYGFLNIMFKILEEEKPDYLTVAFDRSAPTFRHKMFEGYKGTRKPMPEELREQIPVMKEVLQAMHIVIKEQDGIEADDILGTLAKKAEAQGMEVSLVSGDRDLLQIATEHIKIRIPKTKMGRTEIEDYYAEDVVKLYQVTPLQFIELKALMGDTSDNIPGVPKIGEKTAITLMTEYGSIDNIYENLENITKNSIRESLRENRALADLSKVLATIKVDCDITLDYESAKAEDFYTPEAFELFKKLEFKNMLDRFDAAALKPVKDPSGQFAVCSTDEEMIRILKVCMKQKAPVGLYLLNQQKDLLGVAVSLEEEKTFFLPVAQGTKENVQLSLFEEVTEEDHEELLRCIKELTAKIPVFTLDIKKQYAYYAMDRRMDGQKYGTEDFWDCIIAAYLVNPLKNDYDNESVALEYLDLVIPNLKNIVGKSSIKDAMANNGEEMAKFCSYSAYTALHSGKILKEKIREQGMLGLMEEIEMPLSYVLYDMEQQGVKIRPDELKVYGETLQSRISELEQQIYEQAGLEFNINSPKQLGEILFEKMGLPGGKKTKTGYSTAADVLEKLAPSAPVVSDILEYRGLTKLKSTYADGLINYVDEQNRIHSSFNQTITATGRISSTEPNLQNIPMRMELGRQIRKVFVPKEGSVLMDADYSQIELRVLAHMSGDEELIQAYKMDQDIHRITASKVFHTPFEEVTDLQRRNAKAVNFGIVYGISSFGLSQDLSISTKEAKEYIEQYFATYPKVKEFLDGLVESAKKNGYITTMYGRRRPIPELGSSNFMQRSFGERVAMNSPIQGSAADIIKIAMVNVWHSLRKEGLASKLILQVHDELLIETKTEEVEQVRKIMEDNMKHAADLAVALEIDLHTGNNWYEAH